jgi:hypothetical protein
MECLKENQQMTLLADSRILTGTFDYSFEKAKKIYWYHECCRFVAEIIHSKRKIQWYRNGTV